MADAPRFNAYISSKKGWKLLIMPRKEYDRMYDYIRDSRPQQVVIDITKSPISAIAQKAELIVAMAHDFSTAVDEISLYRNDPADGSTPVNQDLFRVWKDLPSKLEFPDMILTCGTEDNKNLREHLRENVYFEKTQLPPDEHHLPELPGDVKISINDCTDCPEGTPTS